MKKFIVPLLLVCLIAVMLPLASMQTMAENSAEEKTTADTQGDALIPDETLVTYGMLLKIKDELREEIISSLKEEGGISVETAYNDIRVNQGEMILLSPDSEVIYRGGGAVAITSSNGTTEGITDMSIGAELFSGAPLEYGHIYRASASDSKKAILVTGTTAYFTVRGNYEIG